MGKGKEKRKGEKREKGGEVEEGRDKEHFKRDTLSYVLLSIANI